MKGIFVILDGASDLPCNTLGGKTPLEVAKMHNLDALARRSKIDYCYPIKKGVAPESAGAVVSLMGYDPRDAPRGPLEAMGAGVKLNKGDLALRCNFATIDEIKGGEILDRRAGRTLTTKEAKILAEAINKKVKLPFKFEFYPTIQHRGVLVFRGGFSDNISGTDSVYGNGMVIRGAKSKIIFSKPLDDEDDSKLSADLVNSFIRKSHDVLDSHPINKDRARRGLFAANFILCRDAGDSPVKFPKLKGKWMALGSMPLEIGIAKSVGMDIYSFKYPKMKGLDVYDNLYAGLKKSMKSAIRMLRWNKKKYDYFYIHLKETDVPGHDNKPFEKVKMLELIDQNFFGYIRKIIKNNKLIVTADHTTACKFKEHTEDPVPVMIYPQNWKNEKHHRFTEKDAAKGKRWIGRRLMKGTMFARGK